LNSPKERETVIIEQENAPDITVELSEFLDVLGSDVRLKILKLLQSKPVDVETISTLLLRRYSKTSSRENTKKHIDKLLSVGLIMKQPGIRDNRAVINYVIVPGAVETIMRTLSKVMKFDLNLKLSGKAAGIQRRVLDEFSRSLAYVRVLGGPDDGQEFLLKKDDIKVGRIDPEHMNKYDPENDVVLSESYKAVTRVWRPHAKLTLEKDQWYVEHCEGKNLTYLWNRRLDKHRRLKLKNGDIISLAKGTKGVRLVFLLPKPEDVSD